MKSLSSPFPDLTNQDSLVVDARQCAKLLSVSERTVFKYTQSGEIPSFRIGHSVRYSIQALKDWIAEQQKQNGSKKRTPAAAQEIKTQRLNKGEL